MTINLKSNFNRLSESEIRANTVELRGVVQSPTSGTCGFLIRTSHIVKTRLVRIVLNEPNTRTEHARRKTTLVPMATLELGVDLFAKEFVPKEFVPKVLVPGVRIHTN